LQRHPFGLFSVAADHSAGKETGVSAKITKAYGKRSCCSANAPNKTENSYQAKSVNSSLSLK
jgi:hypothetical protein